MFKSDWGFITIDDNMREPHVRCFTPERYPNIRHYIRFLKEKINGPQQTAYVVKGYTYVLRQAILRVSGESYLSHLDILQVEKERKDNR